jgi:flavin reductase (DIM6/NTAB) family NADH-FMN oxidoreductase RutF
MNVPPHELPAREFYRILISSVAPRPIAWVSTTSKSGVNNLAPFSFFNAFCATPPMLGFGAGIRSQDLRDTLGSGVKDTLRNVRDTGEFVINIVTFPLVDPMNMTSGEYDPSVDEFALAGLTMRASKQVKPPQVAESPINFECNVYQILDFGTEEAGGSLVIGQIVSVNVQDEVLREGRLDPERLDLVGRMGGIQYCRTRERFELTRPGAKPRTSQK